MEEKVPSSAQAGTGASVPKRHTASRCGKKLNFNEWDNPTGEYYNDCRLQILDCRIKLKTCLGEISNLQSTIFNLQSTIFNLQFSYSMLAPIGT